MVKRERASKRKHSQIEEIVNEPELVPQSRTSDEPIEKKVLIRKYS